MSKAHYYYLQKEKHQRRFSPSIKDNFQTFVYTQRKRGVLLSGKNKSTKIKLNGYGRERADNTRKSSEPTRFYDRFFLSLSERGLRKENNIIFWSFYYGYNQDYMKQNELMWIKVMDCDFRQNTHKHFCINLDHKNNIVWLKKRLRPNAEVKCAW